MKCLATTPTLKLMCMNSKLKTKDGNPMDLRLPGIAGRLKEMDARELASFTALASNNEEKSRREQKTGERITSTRRKENEERRIENEERRNKK